jgi:sterol 24-C-methyltransferase
MEQTLYRTLRLEGQKHVLDAGTGNGDVTVFKAKQSLSIQGIDLLDAHVVQTQANCKRNQVQANVEQGDYQHLNFGSESFDGVYTMETLVHASDPDLAIQEFSRVLKPSGVLVLVEYEHNINPSNLAAFDALEKITVYSHMPAFKYFTQGAIKQKLERVGFQNIEVEDYSRNVLPMFRFFYILALLPYCIFRIFGKEAHVVNAMAAVEFYRCGEDIQYLMIRATKPS